MSNSVIRTSLILSTVACVAIAMLPDGAMGQVSSRPSTSAAQAPMAEGGLVVILGCDDADLVAKLCARDGVLVHGLQADAAKLAKVRDELRRRGLYGKASVEQWDGSRLPYVDNLVNSVVAQSLGNVPMEEVMRVLAPGGAASIRQADGSWKKTVKPRPDTIDEWTHYLHDASNNAVSKDSVVGPPRHLQWVGSPAWGRHHDHMSSMNAMVSAGGRVFYIFDEGPDDSILLPSQWKLIARDAFNGVILWKRPLATWFPTLIPFKSGPAFAPRRLVAVGDKVYVTLGVDAPVECLDAASGKTLFTFEGTKSAEDVIVSEGAVFVVVDETPRDWSAHMMEKRDVRDEKWRVEAAYPWNGKVRSVMAFAADGGKLQWKKQYPVSPLTLAADSKKVYFHDGEKIVALDRKDGSEAWKSEPIAQKAPMVVPYASTLVVYRDVVLFGGVNKKMTAVSADTGKKLWEADHYASGHFSPEDLLIVNGLAWTGDIAKPENSGEYKGLDVHTGEVKAEFPPDVKIDWFHHRCYRSKATEKYIMPSRTGIEFVDLQDKHWVTDHWVRGSCVYGIMPANGMVYAPQHACACYMESKLNGICALAPESPERKAPAVADDQGRLEQGKIYGQDVPSEAYKLAGPNPDWPTYRHDALRSGFTPSKVSADLKQGWQVDLGGKLTAPVLADGKLYVARIDEHTLYALSAGEGKTLWTFTAGGRIDSPPTIWDGRVLFGSADGWVYCLRADDGQMIWRFRAAPQERRMVSFEQVESVWPVHGSVLVQDGKVTFVAGRLAFLDGGLRLIQLDAETGKKLFEKVMDETDPTTGENLQSLVKGLNMPVAAPDVLSSDGKSIYMRSQQLDLSGERRHVQQILPAQQQGEGRHLFSPTGFLDDNWFHRSYWVYGRSFNSGAQGWPRVGHVTPSAGIMVLDDTNVYGYGRKPQYYRWTTPVDCQLFAAGKDAQGTKATTQEMSHLPGDSMYDNTMSSAIPRIWTQDLPMLVRAMVLADKTLFIAGPPKVVDEEDAFSHQNDPKMRAKLEEQAAALKGSQGAIVWAVSAKDGAKLGELKIDSTPVFDGMIASGGRLFITGGSGKVICLVGK